MHFNYAHLARGWKDESRRRCIDLLVSMVRDLRAALERLNPDLPQAAREQAIEKITRIDFARSLIQHNREVYGFIRGGVPVEWRDAAGELRHAHAHVIDFRTSARNRFLAVRELKVQGVRVTDDELALFDLLSKANISKTDRERLKQASRALLVSLQALLKPMPTWTQNTTTQAEVKVFILDNLWQSLPRPPFTDQDAEALSDRVYDYVWQRSASGRFAERNLTS